MGKRTSLNVGGALSLGFAVFVISYTLLRENILPTSIDSIMAHLNHSVHHWHVLVVGLLPVYVALCIFGTAMVTIYLGTLAHRWFTQLTKGPRSR